MTMVDTRNQSCTSGSDQLDWIDVQVRVRDPLVAKLIRDLAERSNAGAEEYGHASILDRVSDPVQLVSDSIEETLDKAVYLMAAKVCLTTPRG